MDLGSDKILFVKEQVTDSPRSAARAFHILVVPSKNYLCKVVDLQGLIIVGARIREETDGLISTRPGTALKKNDMSRYSCQYVRGNRLIEWAYPYVIVDNEMEDWRCTLKLVAESAPLCKPVRSIKGPTLVLRTQGGTSTMLNRWIVLQTRSLYTCCYARRNQTSW